jgi:hypothetical protein
MATRPAYVSSAGLGGGGRLLPEHRVGGLFLCVREARVETVESGREALGVVGVGARRYPP